ncbi:type II secretion system F family protein [Zhihengliuella somnathii]
MSYPMVLALTIGVALGAGLWLTFVRWPSMRRISFADRVAPQLRANVLGSRILGGMQADASAFGPLGSVFGPLLGDLARWLHQINPASGTLESRLRKAGLRITATEFRASQVAWAAAGFLVAVTWTVFGALAGTTHWLPATVLIVAATIAGFFLREWYLGEQIQKRSRRILNEFPSIAELLALSVAAGETSTGAIERISRIVEGELADEFELTLADLRAGATLSAALSRLADRVDLSAMTRFVDATSVAVERGTPLAEVVRAQAQDVRDAAKRELMETAGKKEIGMLVPVVFGVLPLTIVFAVYPGVSLIDLNL